uniref:Uncharacterized protein n=1 Tax=Pyxicephalus adspersus TaxID=30357 RepID=A0AAV2ZG40_PYXAD|nr:TPA: hypothetical protein GDO54_003176 [Pyxicephalus adspersus]
MPMVLKQGRTCVLLYRDPRPSPVYRGPQVSSAQGPIVSYVHHCPRGNMCSLVEPVLTYWQAVNITPGSFQSLHRPKALLTYPAKRRGRGFWFFKSGGCATPGPLSEIRSRKGSTILGRRRVLAPSAPTYSVLQDLWRNLP